MEQWLLPFFKAIKQSHKAVLTVVAELTNVLLLFFDDAVQKFKLNADLCW